MIDFKRLGNVDVAVDKDDIVVVEIQDDIVRGKKLYVHINGVTCLRIGRIEHLEELPKK